MREKLTFLIKSLQSDRRISSFDEAATKQAVVLRLLAILGWDPFNIDEVKPEYIVGGRRVDYALRLANMNKVFIEVKRIGEALEDHQEQLLNYSFQEGVKLAILTNGITWFFYLPLHEGSWEQRRFYTVDLLQQDTEDINARLVDFLSKENLVSGKAIDNAEKIYKSQQKENIIKNALPKAWNKIVSDPDELLIELIGETTEKLSGFRPEADNVEHFLAKYTDRFLISEVEPTPRRHGGTSQPRLTTSPTVKGGYLGKSIVGFTFFGTRHKIKTWKELLVTLSEILYRTHKADFQKTLSMRGTKRVYFSKDPNIMKLPAQVNNSQFYVETHFSANFIVKICLDLLALFGYSEQDLSVEAQ